MILISRDKRKTFEKHSALIKKIKEKEDIVNNEVMQNKAKVCIYDIQ